MTKGACVVKLCGVVKGMFHRDRTIVQMPVKMFPHLKLLCWLFMGPTLGFAI
jgi:hypothetical protein